MKTSIAWQGNRVFNGLSNSGRLVEMDADASLGGTHSGAGPMELIAMGLAGCMAMDVISILEKKRQQVTSFEVNVDAPRSTEYPKVFTSALLTFVVSGRRVDEEALLRSIELAATKYCPAHAMLSRAFPITLGYEIFEEDGTHPRRLMHQGIWQPTTLDR